MYLTKIIYLFSTADISSKCVPPKSAAEIINSKDALADRMPELSDFVLSGKSTDKII